MKGEDSLQSDEIKSNQLKEITKGIAQEIKLPIASIISSSNLLRKRLERHITEEDQVYFNLISKNSNQILRYVEHTINYVLLSNGEKEAIFKKGDICDFILGLCISAEKFALSKKAMLTVNIPNEPIYIAFNLDLLSCAILNLLSNGIKYANDENSVNVSLRDEKDFVYIEVSDNGIGIQIEHLENIFTPYNSHNYSNEYSTGRGLGLYLVKSIAELHQGKVKIESEYGKGTTATIKLPKNLEENTVYTIGNIIKQNEIDYSRELNTIISVELSDI